MCHGSKSAFSEKLAHVGVNFFQWFLIDHMHEFEMGRWRDVFVHLLRIITCFNPALINEIDRRYVVNWFLLVMFKLIHDVERYWAIPTFGKDTIRQFSRNSSDMKKITARDWEDLLQVQNSLWASIFMS